MAETDVHRKLMTDLIETLEDRYANDRMVYVSGNLLVFYQEGDRRKHVSPDVFVVHGVEKRMRENYLIWEEGKGPDAVIELTSKSTKEEDLDDKYRLYAEVLHVPEYFLFDPHGEYLRPPLRGYRLRGREYFPIRSVAGRLPSKVLGLHLERDGTQLRLYDPQERRRLISPREFRKEALAEIERLQRELDARHRNGSRKA
jgi:Uma2 family endonuclease